MVWHFLLASFAKFFVIVLPWCFSNSILTTRVILSTFSSFITLFSSLDSSATDLLFVTGPFVRFQLSCDFIILWLCVCIDVDESVCVRVVRMYCSCFCFTTFLFLFRFICYSVIFISFNSIVSNSVWRNLLLWRFWVSDERKKKIKQES